MRSGGSKAKAARRYEVAESTVYSWLNRPDLRPTIVKRRRRKLDWQAVAEHVKKYPDARLIDRAKHFGVTISSMHYALKQMNITRKKEQKYLERDPRKRQRYLRHLQHIVKTVGSNKLVFIDECGFDNQVSKRYGWSRRGKKLYGNRTGKREKRENLLAVRQNGTLVAPMLVTGSVNAVCFEQWLSQWLIKKLLPNSVLILDNAPIHRKNKIREIAEKKGHQVTFLPKYSPDLNKIEHDFAALKKRR